MENIEKEGLTLAEAAELLGVSVMTLKRHLDEMGISYRKLGTRYIISRTSLMEWLNGKKE